MSLVATAPPITQERARPRSLALLLVPWCAFLFFYGLNTGEFYRTESLRAIIAAEFLRSGNWVVPTLYGEPLLTKPPGMYAAIALVSWPFGGVTEWTARLPSALAATITVLLFSWYFARQLGREAGIAAALILPMTYMWLDKSIAAEIDMLQVAWVTAAILCFLRALEIEESVVSGQWSVVSGQWSVRRWRLIITGRAPSLVPTSAIRNPQSAIRNPIAYWTWWLAALLCVAGGVLTKWTAPVFFYGTVVPLLWWRGRLRLLFGRQHLVSAAVGAGICFAWAGAAIALAGWDAFYDTVSREALQRLSPSHHMEAQQQMGHQHMYPWALVLAHPWKLLGMNLPWSAFALLTLRPGFGHLWDERGRRLLQALHCWTWPNLLFWSIIPEHATRHSFPLFPGIAGLAVMVWVSWLRFSIFDFRFSRQPLASPTSRRLTPARVLIGLAVLWIVAKLAFVHAVIPQRNPTREPRAKGEQIAACVPAGKVLYLFRLKDEGIMFYYSRAHPVAAATGPVLRLHGPAELPVRAEPLYCILDEGEWQCGLPGVRAEALLHLLDEQREPIVLVRVRPHEPPFNGALISSAQSSPPAERSGRTPRR